MHYEPVGYILEYEISALLFLLIVMLRYFGTRRFPNQKNLLFTVILWVTAVDMTLDVVSSVIIDNVFRVPITVTYVVNATFYFLQILLPMLMTMYTLALAGRLRRKGALRQLPLYLPGAVMLLLLLCNPLTRWFFYVDPARGYVHGSLFIYTYLVALFYMGATFFIALRYRAALQRDEFQTICRFLGIVLVAMLVQYLVPELLISGVAIALSVSLMYFTIQNPDTMLDVTSGAFTFEAMLAFLRDRMQERERVQVLAVKIRNMSRINELLGMENGSLLLRQLCRFLQEGAKDSWVFRMRGDCYVAITRNDNDFYPLCERVRKRVEQPWMVGSTEILLQATVCSVRTEELSSEPIPPMETVNYLETAFLQNERSSNRKTNITFGPALVEQIKRSRAGEAALRSALESGEELELYFQPLWSVKHTRFMSVETLLRFRHPSMGVISPEEFVPIAENCGLVTAMDELVVRRACEFIRDHDGALRAAGIETVEINLSALEFMHHRLPAWIRSILMEYRVDPKLLCFEITETAATESFELLKKCMQELSESGCRFALDDFGTGYANISQVIQLPFSIVKLDRTLLYGPKVVLEDMARMFTRMERTTVIEGVETSEQAERMHAVQVDFIQGFYYARPMRGQDLLRFLQAQTPREAAGEFSK